MAASLWMEFIVTAVVLGFTHGIEPDHLAGITSLTQDAGNSRLSALVGSCFAFGHAAVVVVWVAFVSFFLGVTTFPPVLEQIGLVTVGLILSMLALSLGITGTRRLIHKHDHSHDDGLHTHYHLHFPDWFSLNFFHTRDHEHEHGLRQYLRVGLIGPFSLSLSPNFYDCVYIAIVGES